MKLLNCEEATTTVIEDHDFVVLGKGVDGKVFLCSENMNDKFVGDAFESVTPMEYKVAVFMKERLSSQYTPDYEYYVVKLEKENV